MSKKKVPKGEFDISEATCLSQQKREELLGESGLDPLRSAAATEERISGMAIEMDSTPDDELQERPFIQTSSLGLLSSYIGKPFSAIRANPGALFASPHGKRAVPSPDFENPSGSKKPVKKSTVKEQGPHPSPPSDSDVSRHDSYQGPSSSQSTSSAPPPTYKSAVSIQPVFTESHLIAITNALYAEGVQMIAAVDQMGKISFLRPKHVTTKINQPVSGPEQLPDMFPPAMIDEITQATTQMTTASTSVVSAAVGPPASVDTVQPDLPDLFKRGGRRIDPNFLMMQTKNGKLIRMNFKTVLADNPGISALDAVKKSVKSVGDLGRLAAKYDLRATDFVYLDPLPPKSSNNEAK